MQIHAVSYVNGDIYVGALSFLTSKVVRHGKGVLIKSNRDVFDGWFEHDVLQGQAELRYANGDIYQGDAKAKNI